jgi:hypothetical protein
MLSNCVILFIYLFIIIIIIFSCLDTLLATPKPIWGINEILSDYC